MQLRSNKLFFGLLSLLPASALEKVSSLQPIIKLLTDMKSENEREEKEALKVWDEVEQTCEDTATTAEHRLVFLKQKRNTQASESQEQKGTKEKAHQSLGTLSHQLQELENELKDSETLLKKKTTQFSQLDSESAETIDMVGRAIKALQKKKGGSDSFLQSKSLKTVEDALDALTSNSLLELKHAERISALLQQPAQASVSNYDSGMEGVIDMFEEFLTKQEAAKSERSQEWGKESADLRLLNQQMSSNAESFKREIDRAKESESTASEKQAIADGKVSDFNVEISETQKVIADNRVSCKQAKSAFERRMADFAAEKKSVTKALEILSKAPGLLQDSKTPKALDQDLDDDLGISFLQMSRTKTFTSSSEDSDPALKKTQAAIFLQRIGLSLNSLALQQLATRVEQDPFSKVRSMIENMIAKLSRDGEAEKSKHEYCTKETASSAADVKAKQESVDKVSSRIEDREAGVKDLEKTAKKQSARLSEIEKTKGEMTRERDEEKKENERDVKTASANEKACSEAIDALQEFYGESSDTETSESASSFVQTKTKSKTGTRDADSVIYLLQEAEAEYAKQSADSKASESSAQREYDQEMQDLDVERATLTQSVKDAAKEVVRIKTTLSELQTDHDNALSELKSSKAYEANILEKCEHKEPTFEEKQRERNKEVQGLQTALNILQGE